MNVHGRPIFKGGLKQHAVAAVAVCVMHVHYEGMWTKSEGQSGKASRKIKNSVIRTCSPRTSNVFLRVRYGQNLQK